MKWFQHDSNASHDAKVKKLILRYGPEGYAVYFHCLELIAGDLTQNNINFELEHDAEIIADNLKIQGDNNTAGVDKVNKILKTIIELGLFTMENNRVFCFKMANRLDNTVSRSPEINKIKSLRTNYVANTKKLGAEENRIDKKRIEKNTIKENREEEKKATKVAKPTRHKYGTYNNVLLTDKQYTSLVDEFTEPVISHYIENMSSWQAKNGKSYKNYLAAIKDWIKRDKETKTTQKPNNQKSWGDLWNEMNQQ
jgi:hypothetical protein